MALIPGTRLGPYEVSAQIGVGGMGEVYKATDTHLKRAVAIKVLPASVAAEVERLARFQREAEVLASLNHPNIAAIYGLEKSDRTIALVMELVEGPTLADRIAKGPIPVDEALPIAKQIAEALEAAHEQGIIHRDLKPANVKVRDDGTVKVLDFGLAKAMEVPGGMSAGVSQAPTITTPAMMTGVGMILGTAAYMAPEQARGKSVDKRSDIWSFGCVLYEMLTGQRAFGGDDVAEVLGAVVRLDPDWGVLPATTAPVVRSLIYRCLEKDPRQRISDISTARFALDQERERSRANSANESRVADSGRSVREGWRRAALATATLFLGAVLIGAAVWFGVRPSQPPIARFEITRGASVSNLDRDLALTPNGATIVYRESAVDGDLVVRHLNALEPTSVFTGSPRGLFASPDGLWIGFFDSAGGGLLKKVSNSGGPALTITSVDGSPRGAVWLPDDTIVFATANPDTGLQQVAATGGPVSVLTRPNRAIRESDHLWPETLRNGAAVLYTIKPETGGVAGSQIAVHDRQSGRSSVVARGGAHAHYISTGHLVYGTEGVLNAVPFDSDTLTTRGTSVPVVSGIATTPDGGMDAVVTGNGTLAYIARTGGAFPQRQIVWIDRSGREEAIAAELRQYQHPRISPNGEKLAIDTGGEAGVWIWDFARATASRLTTDPTLGSFRAYPVWSPDGQTITFTSDPKGARNLFRQASDGSGTVERLTTSPNLQHPYSVTPDGKLVLFKEIRNGLGGIYAVSAAGGDQPRVVLVAPFDHPVVDLSPDGRWMAVQSNESGRFEVYVRPFPDVNSGRWQASANGGTFPAWARSGRELFYVASDGGLMSVTIETETSFAAGRPAQVVKPGFWTGSGTTGRPFDVSADGKRFLMIKPVGEESSLVARLIVVENWFEELKRLVPTN